MEYEAIVYDIDGTLLNTVDMKHVSINSSDL